MKFKFYSRVALWCAYPLLGVLVSTANSAVADDDEVVVKTMKLDGRTVNDVRVTAATPIQVTISFGGANLRVLDRKNLPPELAQAYPYDPKAAADYEKQQEVEKEKRTKDLKLQQERARQQQKLALQQRRATAQTQIGALEAELARVQAQTDDYRLRVRRRRTAQEVLDLDRLESQIRDLKARLRTLHEQVKLIDRQALGN